MTGREKIEAALSPDGTPEIPVVICYENFFIRDHWDQLTDAPWWYAFETDLDRQMRWRKDVTEKIGLDWYEIPTNHIFSEEARKHIRIQQQGDDVFRIDTRTGQKERLIQPHWSHTAADLSSDPDRLPKNDSDIDNAIRAANARVRINRIDAGENGLARRLHEAFSLMRFPMTYLTPPLANVFFIWGYEAAMIMIATQPDLVEYACIRLYELNQIDIKTAADIGAAGIWVEDTLTDMIGPDDYDRLNATFLKKIAEEIHLLGMKSIYYFCGNPEGKWDSILSIGTDALAFEESKKGFVIDLETVVDRVAGKYTLFGNLDVIEVLQNASSDRLKSEIEKQIRFGRKNNNRFIMSTGSPITPGTPADRVKEYVDLVRRLAARSTG